MSKHVKPTVEELDEGINKSLEELDKDPDIETPKEDTEEVVTPTETPKENPEETEIPDKEDGETPEEKELETPKEEPVEEKPVEEEPDKYKKRYEDSSREAHILYSKNKKLTEVIDEATQLPEPTEEELTTEYPEWEVMSELEKKLARENYLNNRRFQKLGEATKEFRDIEVWNGKVDTFILDPETMIKFPKLEGKEEAFKIFASKPTHRGVDMETLTTSFLWEESQKPPVQNKGKMFEMGSAGLNDKPRPKSNKITVAESLLLRQTDYKKYLYFVKNDLIEGDVE